jgi:hypothetical protein
MANIKAKITTGTHDTLVELYDIKGVTTGIIDYIPHNNLRFRRLGGADSDYFDIWELPLMNQNKGVNLQKVKYDEMIVDGVTPASASAAVTALRAAFFF